MNFIKEKFQELYIGFLIVFVISVFALSITSCVSSEYKYKMTCLEMKGEYRGTSCIFNTEIWKDVR